MTPVELEPVRDESCQGSHEYRDDPAEGGQRTDLRKKKKRRAGRRRRRRKKKVSETEDRLFIRLFSACAWRKREGERSSRSSLVRRHLSKNRRRGRGVERKREEERVRRKETTGLSLQVQVEETACLPLPLRRYAYTERARAQGKIEREINRARQTDRRTDVGKCMRMSV